MRKMRKGFTLIELLIVISILGALSAAMSMSGSGAAAKAKATAIANNLRICTSGAQLYYFQHADDEDTDIDTINTKVMLDETVPNFPDFSEGKIAFTSKDAAGPDNWEVTVTLTGTDATEIVEALQNIKGFKDASTTTNYKVFSGTIKTN